MKIESYHYNGYRIIDVKEDIGLFSDLKDVKELVKKCLQQNEIHFAFSFSEKSYLSSDCIAIIVVCMEMIREKGGELSIITPNEDNKDIVSILNTLHIDNLIKTFQSKEELVSS